MESIMKSTFALRLTKILSNKLTLTISFALLTAVAAQIAVPVKPVPFTLQTMAVVLAGAFLGSKRGFQSQIIYLTLGLIGLPVFAISADATVGFARLIGPTGGYLLSFPIAAYLVGLIVERYKNYFAVVSSMFLGNIVIVLLGTFYLDLLYIHNLSQSLKAGAVIFSIWTVVKVMMSASIYFGIKKSTESK
jgi:biotin transport system substrate-specific component